MIEVCLICTAICKTMIFGFWLGGKLHLDQIEQTPAALFVFFDWLWVKSSQYRIDSSLNLVLKLMNQTLSVDIVNIQRPFPMRSNLGNCKYVTGVDCFRYCPYKTSFFVLLVKTCFSNFDCIMLEIMKKNNNFVLANLLSVFVRN